MSDAQPGPPRSSSRVRLALHAELRVDNVVHSLDIKNVSLSGVCLTTTEPFPIGASCHVALLLEGSETPQRCDLDGTIVRNGSGEVGIVFSEVVGIESFEHLHNLLLYNATEPQRIAEEFEHFRGLRRKD